MATKRNPQEWRKAYNAHISTARLSILHQILTDSPVDFTNTIKSSSRIVVSNTDMASALVDWYHSQHGPHAPTPDLIIARDLTETVVLPEGLGGMVPLRLLEELNAREGRFTQVVLYLDEPLGEYDVIEVLKQCRRALRDGGTLVVFTSNVDAVTSTLQAVGLNPGRQVKPFAIEGLKRLLGEAGFEEGKLESAFSKSYVTKGVEIEKLATQLSFALEGALPACAENEGWKLEFKEAVEREERNNEGLMYGADVVVAMK